MRGTKLRIFTALAGLAWAGACTDSIGTPNTSETDEIETTEEDSGAPDSGSTASDGGTEPQPDAGPQPQPDAGPQPQPDAGPVVCDAGFAIKDGECMDVDECAIENGGCGDAARATCTNNVGAPPICTDVNECLENNGGCGSPAEYFCANQDKAEPVCNLLTACAVDNGGCGDPAFTACSVSTTGIVSCSDIDECASDNGGCGAPSAMTCVSSENARNSCVDIDECADANLNTCPIDRPCVNVKGSYACGCDFPNLYDAALGACRPVRVLVLEDGGRSEMIAALTAQGFAATSGGYYFRWDQTADLSGVDTILWLEGQNYGNPLLPGVQQAIVAFVQGGGGLVRTEWGLWYSAYQARRGISVNPLVESIMPVGLPDSDEYGDSAGSWTITAPSSPLASGLPDSIVTTGGYTVLDVLPGSEAVATTVDRREVGTETIERVVPTLSYTAIHGGITVHINDSLLYNNGVRTAIEPEIMRVYFNAVHFSAQRPGN